MMRLIGRMDHRMADEFTGDFRGLRQTTPRHDRPTHGGGVSVPGAMRHIRQLVVDQLTLARDAGGSAHHIVAQRAVPAIDALEHDVLGARKAGLDCVAVSYGYGTEEELAASQPLQIVASAEEILDFFV